MKKLISTILLLSMAVAFSFAAPKKGKDVGTKLDPKNKFAIEGVAIDSITWAEATVSNKGEILWSRTKDGDWHETGWDLRGIDLSNYAGIRFELAPKQDIENNRIMLTNPASTDSWTFIYLEDGVCYVFFNGVGKSWGNMKNPDPTEGYEIKIANASSKTISKTVFKSITLLTKEVVPDTSNLDVLGTKFGSYTYKSYAIGNEIQWVKGGEYGWNFSGVDLSEYNKVRIELESNTSKDMVLHLRDPNHENCYSFSFTEQNVFEANLTGEGYSWKEENAQPLDKSKGIKIFLTNLEQKKGKTVVKSIQFLKDNKIKNENLQLLDVPLKSFWDCLLFDNGEIQWTKDYGTVGWNLQDTDLSAYKKVRIETEGTEVFIRQKLSNGAEAYYWASHAIKPGVFEVNLDGSNASMYENGEFAPGLTTNELHIVSHKIKKGDKTTVKAVTLLSSDTEKEQPANIMLNDLKLGSARENAWLDDDFSINWNKANYAKCGWKFEKLEGDILEIKVSSTDVPLRLRIRENAKQNEACWADDGTHVFRIELKTKYQLWGKSSKKPAEWTKNTKAFDFSQGGEIVLEPYNGIFKEGKKTVVESISVK